MLGSQTGQRLIHVRAELDGALVDGIQGMADLLAFGREEHHLGLLRTMDREWGNLEGRMARIAGLHGALTGLLMNLATLAVLAMGILLVDRSTLDGVYLALLALAVVASFEAVFPLPQAFQYLDGSLEAARRLFEIADAEPTVSDPSAPIPLPAEYGLRVENLCFAYAPGERPALEYLSF